MSNTNDINVKGTDRSGRGKDLRKPGSWSDADAEGHAARRGGFDDGSGADAKADRVATTDKPGKPRTRI